MDDKICLDTDFLVNLLRNKKEESEFAHAHEGLVFFATTVITIFELYHGAYKSGVWKNIEKVHELQEKVRILPFTNRAAEKAGSTLADLEKKGTPIEFRDLFIGTIAEIEGFSMKTHNKKHFSRIPGLKIV